MNITWPEIVAALEQLGRDSAKVPSDFRVRVMRRITSDGLPPATTQPLNMPTMWPTATLAYRSQQHDI